MISPATHWRASADTSIKRMLGGHVEFPEPDFRLRYLLDNFPCDRYDVVEFGCWHGWHTVPIARHFRHVTSIDVRPENIAKTLLRLNLLGITNVDVKLANVEDFDFICDVLVHVGVLYHLSSPVAHLYRVLAKCHILCLDTHINKPGLTPSTESYNGRIYSGGIHKEHGWDDPLSGIDAVSLWLDEDVLREIILSCGFVIVNEERHEVAAGPRISIVAARTSLFV